MSSADARARRRWFAMVGVQIAGTAGAVLGIVLVAKAPDTPTKALGIALVLAALLVIAIVPRSLARRWRTPVE